MSAIRFDSSKDRQMYQQLIIQTTRIKRETNLVFKEDNVKVEYETQIRKITTIQQQYRVDYGYLYKIIEQLVYRMIMNANTKKIQSYSKTEVVIYIKEES